MVDTETLEFPQYASVVTPEARKRRDALPPELRLKVMEISEQLAMNPKVFESRTQKWPKGMYLYEHPDPPFQITYELVEEGATKVIKFLHFAAIQMVVKRTLFISYSHEDKEYVVQLKKFLKGLEDQDIALWDDSQIKASARWQDEITKALTAAKAAILLVSQDFLISDFIQTQELPTLLKKAEGGGLKVFWIPARPSTFEGETFCGFQAAVDDPGVALSQLEKPKREEQFVRIYKKIAEAMAVK